MAPTSAAEAGAGELVFAREAQPAGEHAEPARVFGRIQSSFARPARQTVPLARVLAQRGQRVIVEGRAHGLTSTQMPNSVVVGTLRAIHPDHIILGGGLYIMLPAHVSIDGVQVGTSLTVVVHQEDEHLVAESSRKTSGLMG